MKFFGFDTDGRYLGEFEFDMPEAPHGYTEIAPEGYPWSQYFVDGRWQEAPVVQEPRYISVGAFFDRFGDQKWPILSSTDPGVQGMIKDASVRKWIDLDNAQLPTGLDLLIAAGFEIDKEAILTSPIQPHERP